MEDVMRAWKPLPSCRKGSFDDADVVGRRLRAALPASVVFLLALSRLAASVGTRCRIAVAWCGGGVASAHARREAACDGESLTCSADPSNLSSLPASA
jgi:hypothetical protein